MNSLVPIYFRDAKAVIIAFDITNRDSFVKTKEWSKVARTVGQYERAVIVLVGNKVDMASVRQVSFEEAHDFANGERLSYFETSAKEVTGVTDLFDAIAQRLLEGRKRGDFAEKRGATVRAGLTP
ncbi:Small GTPase superfamily, partial [Aphelenchoides avenae]